MMELKVKEYKPIFNQIKISAYRFKPETKLVQDEGSKILTPEEITNSVKPYQKVLAIGPTVRSGFKVGDWVMVDVSKFRVGKKNESNMEETASKLGAHENYRPVVISTFKETDQEVILLYDNQLAYSFVPENEDELING